MQLVEAMCVFDGRNEFLADALEGIAPVDFDGWRAPSEVPSNCVIIETAGCEGHTGVTLLECPTMARM